MPVVRSQANELVKKYCHGMYVGEANNSKGIISAERILQGRYMVYCHTTSILLDVREDVGHRAKRQDFAQTVSRNNFLSNQDIHNIQRSLWTERVSISESDFCLYWTERVKRHENDATSVSILVQELK